MRRLRLLAGITAGALLPGLASVANSQSSPANSKYLFVWSGDGARKVSDFLAVLDADPSSKSYGHVVASVPAGAVGTMPHHTEYEFPADGMLLANGWVASKTFLFDVRQPTAPRLVTSFGAVGPYSFPHSFVRLPNGHLLGTFQGAGKAYAPPGGLVEMDERGTFVRSASAVGAGIRDTMAWPYSLVVDAKHDRIVTTNTTMGYPAWNVAPAGSWPKARVDSVFTDQLQLWSLSKLELLRTIQLPKPPRPKPDTTFPRSAYPAEPRLLPNGSIYVNTFSCGLYHVTGVETPTPRATFVHEFPLKKDMSCGVPAIAGHYWVQTVPSLPGLIALDISNPSRPEEVSRVVLDQAFAMPHWLASDAKGSRVVLTGDNMGYVLIVNVDPRTGKLSVDKRFRDERTGAVGVRLDGRTWPHGAIKSAYIHGTLFGPR